MSLGENVFDSPTARWPGLRDAALRAFICDGEVLWNRVAGALFVLLAAVFILTFDDYGVTWDEDVHNQYGVFVLEYYTSFFQNTRALSWLNLYNYGAAFDMIAAILNRFSPIGIYETRHLLNAAIGLLGVVGTFKLGRFFGGPRAGLLAAVFIVANPTWYGHSFNNPKDIPFAVAVVWATYYMVRIIPSLPRPPMRLLVKLGAAAGLALGVRVGGLLLLCYLGLLLALWATWRLAETRDWRVSLADAWTAGWRVFLPAVAVAYPVMLVFWPWAQVHPLDNPLRALAFFSHETFPFKVIFFGEYVPATDLPWSYLPVHLVLKTPELILALLAVAPVWAVILLRRHGVRGNRNRILQHFMVAFGIVFPVAYAVAIHAVLFDGMRHFIFVLPLAGIFAALVADLLLDRLAKVSWRGWVYGGVGAYAAAHVAMMVALHPDQYVYYNGLIGWTPGAEGKFKLDYWANSYAEAVDGLQDHLHEQYGADLKDKDFTVAVCGPPISADYFFPANFIFTEDWSNADFFIAFTKDDCHKTLPGNEIFRVEKMGTLLSVVLDRREIIAARDRPSPDTVAHARGFAIGSELD
jgi:hypothetical protein